MHKITLTVTLAFLLGAPALAQVRPPQTTQVTTGPQLLTGTTYGLPWGIYAGGPTDKTDGDARLRLSVPQGVRILGQKYDNESKTANVTYRSNLNARQSLAQVVDQLREQGFTLGSQRFPNVGNAQATLYRTERFLDVQVIRDARGVTNVTYTFGSLETLTPDSIAPQIQRVLSGTADGQPWTVLNMPPTNSMVLENRLYFSPPVGAKLLGSRYDAAQRTLVLTYRSNLDAKVALAFAGGELINQNFVKTLEEGNVDQATASLSRQGWPVRIQTFSHPGYVNVTYVLGRE